MLLLSQPFIALTGFQPGTSTAKGKSVEPVGHVRAAQKEKLPLLNEEFEYRPNLYGTDLPDPAAAAQNRKMRESQHKHRNAQSVSSHQ